MADVEPAEVKVAVDARAGLIDVDVKLGVDRRRLIVDDRGMLEDRCEPIELELRSFEIDRRRALVWIERALGGP
jgi:hypothetical protein